MWQLVVSHWEGLASVLGVLAAIGFPVWKMLRDRSAAQKAKQDNLGNELHQRAVLLERALSFIRQIRDLHRSDRWDEALNQYQTLRTVITDITGSYPDNAIEARKKLTRGRLLVGRIETDIHGFGKYEPSKQDKIRLIRRLNDVQVDLESLASDQRFSSRQEGTT